MNSSLQTQTIQKGKTLSDFASESLILILQLKSINNFGNANTIKAKVAELLEEFERSSRSAGYDNEKIQLAKFALVAFLDETIISSAWDQKDEWLSEPLQLKLFDSFNAGEEFFDNIKLLRQRTARNKDVLEVYYLCLVLGFKGKYQLQSPEILRKMTDDLNSELHPQTFNSIDVLSPNAKVQDVYIPEVKSSLPVWVYPLAAVTICILLYIFLSLTISSKADSVIKDVIKFIS